MLQKSENIGSLVKALSAVQEKLQPAAKSANNPFFKSKYADLTDVWNSCRQLLTENGLSVIQTTTVEEASNGVTVQTTLAHTSGEWITGELYMPVVKKEPQAVGSAITYARRYALSAIVGITADDDDGEAAMGRYKGASQKQATRQTTEPANPNGITQKQRHELFTKAKEAYGDDFERCMKEKLQRYGYNSTSEITKDNFEKMLIEINDVIEANKG